MSHLSGERAVATAALIATLAHSGQVDKAGQPYVDHPRRVAARVFEHGPLAEAVAWLHDVVEDTPVTLEAVEQAFGPQVAAAVDAITHRPGEPRTAYYARVRSNPVALVVKDADIDDNTDPLRLAALDPALASRLQVKYAAARASLHD